jgi:Transposase DDE domain group 1
LRVQRDGRDFTVDVTSDGEGLVSHAGSVLLAQVADRTGLTRALSLGLAGMKERCSGHDPGRVVRDLAVMLADGGECVSDLGGLRDQLALFGRVASYATAYRVIERIACEPELVDALRAAHAQARAHAWELGVKPARVTIDLDATLITAHSEKDGAAGNFKGGFGFQPMLAYLDESSEALAGILRPGSAAAHNAADQIAVAESALDQIPREHIAQIEILLRTDSAGAAHKIVDWCREGRIGFSVGFDLTEPITSVILELPEGAWAPALDQDGKVRPNGQVTEITSLVDLSSWPERSRLICRRERAHPGAQLSFTDHDGHRFQVFLTDQDDHNIAILELRQRQRAHVEDHIRNDKDTGLRKLPFCDFQMNQVWLYLVLIAHDLISWSQTLLLDGELAKAEPKRLRYRNADLAVMPILI